MGSSAIALKHQNSVSDRASYPSNNHKLASRGFGDSTNEQRDRITNRYRIPSFQLPTFISLKGR
ncbi:MAG TPA: hypothetical protein DDW76_34360 [Cyanobacteria bacterium UBA11369]|nr:hypothetical protein [Cyanobacteria bacterium UBA11371]HBE32099.1 hypothetical protein [Cyanobacteria bacterium UBA11368]HBE53699.1 hypothetical protein [Cyanobacteria bacterium UBA11369]